LSSLQGDKNEKETNKKKRLMYIYLPQMHMLSFGGAFSTTPLQQCLLQHRHFNTTFATPSSSTSLQHRLCNIVFYNTMLTPLVQHHLLHHRFNTTYVGFLQHNLCNIIFCNTAYAL
jgi:hypothetical protein